MYTVLQVPSGLLADRIGRKAVLIPGYLLQGIGGVLSGLAPGAAFFLGSRIAAGTGQGTYYSAQYAIAAAEIPKERRALGTAIINSGMSVGIASGLTIASLMVYRFGLPWRWPFIILGVLTMLLSLAMALIIREERPGKAQSATTMRPADARPTSGMDAAAWRTLILMGIFNLAVMYGFYVILTWLPYYLQTVRGYSGGEAGLVSTIMPLVAIPAAIISAQRSDKAGSRRKVMLSLLPIAALALILIVASGSRIALYLALVLYGISGKLVVDPLMVALVADVAPKDAYGTVFGILNFVGSAAMVLAPTVTGYIADTTGSFNGGLYLAAALIAVAWTALWFVRERPQAARS
jgi:MFS family permease